MLKSSFIFILSLMLCSFSGVTQEVVETLKISIQTKDSKDFAQFFDNTVDLTYGNTQSTYSRTQAQMILNDFYSKNNPQSFKIDFTGNAPNNEAQYVIGTIKTATGKFKLYLYIKSQGNKQLVKEIKISQ